MADLLVLPRPAKSLQNGTGFSRKTRQAEKKEWLQCHRERAVDKYARAVFAKRERNRAVCPGHQIVRMVFGVGVVKRTAAKERKRGKYSSAEEQ